MARDKHYEVKTLRLSEETWTALKKLREDNDISWNLFIKQMIESYGSNENNRAGDTGKAISK